jgi:hypothetical protein
MPDWVTPQVIISSSLALLAISVSVFLYRLQRRFKALTYQVSPAFPILSVRESVKGSVKILYEDKLVEGIEGVTIKIQNAGSEPIQKADFDRPVTVDFGEGAQILEAEIAEKKPDETEADIIINESSVQLTPTLLNPDDFVTMSVLLTQFEKDKPDVEGRIVGVKRIVERAGDPAAIYWWRNRTLIWSIIIILAVWVLILVSIVVDDLRGYQEISLWDWVGVLIIPVVLAASAALISNSRTPRR